MCFRVHDLPVDFDFDPVQRCHVEPNERTEVRASSIEYIAPADYMVRPPPPAIHIFLIDVSYTAVANGPAGVVFWGWWFFEEFFTRKS
jgi:protein transport protein SEC24